MQWHEERFLSTELQRKHCKESADCWYPYWPLSAIWRKQSFLPSCTGAITCHFSVGLGRKESIPDFGFWNLKSGEVQPWDTSLDFIVKTVLTAGIHIDLYRQFGGGSHALGKFSLAIQAWTWSAQVALEIQVLLGHGLGGHEQECHWLGLQYGWSTILRPSSLQRQCWLLVSILTLIGNLAEAVLHWGSSALWCKPDLEVQWLHLTFWLS